MVRTISEPDWKLFRKLHALALDRFCGRVLAEANQLAISTDQTNHERYLALYKLLQNRDKKMSAIFDDICRSTAYTQLAHMRTQNLITDEEFDGFSADTREVVHFYCTGL